MSSARRRIGRCRRRPRSVHVGRRAGFVRGARAKGFIDELAGLGAKEIRLTGGGEPFLHPGVMKIMRHVKARGMIMPVTDPAFGTFGFARTPPHMSSNPELPSNPAPALGQHTRPILQDLLGYDSKDVDALAADGVVQTAD